MLKPGTRVRCAYRGDHEGTVLDPTDPELWRTSADAALRNGTRKQIREHLKAHRLGQLPVRWDFGGGTVYWDTQLSPV